MSLRNVLTCTIVLTAVLALRISADEEGRDVKLECGGFAYFQVGQHFNDENDAVNNKNWDQTCNGRVSVQGTIKERLKIIVGAEGRIWVHPENQDVQNSRFALSPKEMQGIFTWGDLTYPWLEMALGYYPYKYNKDAQNLGEYLMRSGTYPPFIVSDFENAKARLLGMRLSSILFENLKMDLLFTSELVENPIFDYSLSFLAGYYLAKFLDIGAGFSWHRMIPVVNEKTTPPGSYVLDENDELIIDGGDTLLLTKRGIKAMARLSFDIKNLLFRDAAIFGERDLRLYAEAAVLGWKDYGKYYSNRLERMPIMIGFNVPAFNVLDLLALEMEVYTSPFENDPSNADVFPGQPRDWHEERDNIKWSAYVKKTIWQGWSASALVASDHFRSYSLAGLPATDEVLYAPEHWHYKIRIMYSF